MFEGRFSNTLDDKGRVAIPARYREALSATGQDRIVVTAFDIAGVPCLEAYDARAWQDLVVNVQSKGGAFAEDRALFESFYIGEAQHCQPDKQGRILIPPSLREYAALADEVVFVGVGRKFQIFSPSERQKVNEQFRAKLRQNPDRFHDVG